MGFKEYFEGKKVIITGTGRGIARALAKRLDGYGCTVYALSRTEERLKTLREECPNVITVCVDLSDWEATKEVMENIEPVDFLVNSAIHNTNEYFMTLTPEEYDKASDVKIKATINVSQVVARKMIENQIKGSILNISSIAGFRAQPNEMTQCVLDAALNMLTKIMALELGPKGIRVNAICPSGIESEALEEYAAKVMEETQMTRDQLKAMYDAKIPIGKCIMEMDEALDSILIPLSRMSSFLHGECMIVDGGYSLV